METDIYFNDKSGWHVRVPVEITPEERAILTKDKTDLSEEQLLTLKETTEAISARGTASASPDQSASAQAIFESHNIAESEVMEVVISLPSGRGIINCRVGGEHKQIRF